MDDSKANTSGCGIDSVGNRDSTTAHRESDSTMSALQPQTSGKLLLRIARIFVPFTYYRFLNSVAKRLYVRTAKDESGTTIDG